MKNLLFILSSCLILAACTFTSKTKEESSSHESNAKVISASILSDNKDYSCGMTLQDGNIADTTTYNGKVYGFCATGCKDEFLKDPEAALKK